MTTAGSFELAPSANISIESEPISLEVAEAFERWLARTAVTCFEFGALRVAYVEDPMEGAYLVTARIIAMGARSRSHSVWFGVMRLRAEGRALDDAISWMSGFHCPDLLAVLLKLRLWRVPEHFEYFEKGVRALRKPAP